jgi:twitching motility protein PilU
MNERQREEFAKDFECNLAISIPGLCRFRVNVFVQQQQVGMVIRTIASENPTFEKLGLPESLKEIVMNKGGLSLVVGATGSGKSTSLAAIIDDRNSTSSGHIRENRTPQTVAGRRRGRTLARTVTAGRARARAGARGV